MLTKQADAPRRGPGWTCAVLAWGCQQLDTWTDVALGLTDTIIIIFFFFFILILILISSSIGNSITLSACPLPSRTPPPMEASARPWCCQLVRLRVDSKPPSERAERNRCRRC